MAVRFDATTDYLRRTTSLPGITSFTAMGWFKINVDLNNFSTFMDYGEANGFGGYVTRTDEDGVTFGLLNGSTEWFGSVLTVGTWYHVAMTVAGTGAGQFLGYLNGVLDITASGDAGVPSEQLMVGGWDTSGSEWLNGCAAAVKIYSAVLTQQQIAIEMRSVVPVRTLNLHTWSPLRDVGEAAANYTNSAALWTVGGTLATEAGPPIAWAPYARYRRRAAAVVAGAPVVTRQRPMIRSQAVHRAAFL